MKVSHILSLLFSTAILASCVSPRYSYNDGFEEDDIYFSDSDPEEYNYSSYVNEEDNKATEEDEYDYQDDYYSDDYKSEEYDDGGDTYVTNNYYGNNWSPNYRPFNSRPGYGWNMGYNSYGGWSFGFNYNYGFSSFGYSSFSNPYYGWNNQWYYDPWYSPWGYCGNSFGYGWGYNPYNPYYGYGYGYGYGGYGYGYGGFYGDTYYAGNSSGFHYGHRTPISTGSNLSSTYTAGTILDDARDRGNNESTNIAQQQKPVETLASERPDSKPVTTRPPTGSTASNDISSSREKPNIILSEPSTQVIRDNKERPGTETQVARTERPNPSKFNNDYYWNAPTSREDKPDHQKDDYFQPRDDRQRDSFMERNQPKHFESRPQQKDINNRPQHQKDNNSFNSGSWNNSNNNKPARESKTPSFNNSRSNDSNKVRSNPSNNSSKSRSGNSSSNSSRSGGSSNSTKKRR
jgi:hypothetical protein